MEFDAHAGNHEGPIKGVSAEQVLSTMARASAGAGHPYQLVQATLINWCRPLLPELRSCVKVEVAVLGYPALIFLMVSVDV